MSTTKRHSATNTSSNNYSSNCTSKSRTETTKSTILRLRRRLSRRLKVMRAGAEAAAASAAAGRRRRSRARRPRPRTLSTARATRGITTVSRLREGGGQAIKVLEERQCSGVSGELQAQMISGPQRYLSFCLLLACILISIFLYKSSSLVLGWWGWLAAC